MPIGTIALIVVGVLIYFGVAHRMLDRMRLTDRAALWWIGAILVGSLISFTLVRFPTRLTLNVGGGLVPIALGVWLVVTADEAAEKTRAVVAALLAGGAVWAMRKFLPVGEPQNVFEPQYLYAVAAAAVAYAFGRSRRAAFVAGVWGVLLADLAGYFETFVRPVPGVEVFIGGGGAFDTIVIAGLGAVLLAEVVGETLERIQGGPQKEGRDTRGLRTPGEGGEDPGPTRGEQAAGQPGPMGLDWTRPTAGPTEGSHGPGLHPTAEGEKVSGRRAGAQPYGPDAPKRDPAAPYLDEDEKPKKDGGGEHMDRAGDPPPGPGRFGAPGLAHDDEDDAGRREEERS